MTQQLFDRVVRVTIESDTYKGTFSSEEFEIRFDTAFTDEPKPNESKIELLNLNKTTINRIKRKSKVTIQAGYKGDVGVLATGRVTAVSTIRDNVDNITTITMLDGEDYGEKSGDITFKANTDARTIINRLAGKMGLKIASMSLPRNKNYNKGYTVSGELEMALSEVVKDCGASIYYRRGRMVIRSIKSGDDERFTLEEATGLLGAPEPFEEEDAKGYKIQSLLQHRISTASIIELKSIGVKGKYRAKRGRHICSGSDFKTEVDVIS
ncbi:phage protein [Shouchella lehensis]|uniref:phage protein n=1 Tax=Shouchella lehensis TaxID=300825 RepID=UPI001F50CA54|nr:hypothetical protein [Shouchella lehensis]